MLTWQLIRDIFFKDQNNSQKNYVWNDSIKEESLESHIPSNTCGGLPSSTINISVWFDFILH